MLKKKFVIAIIVCVSLLTIGVGTTLAYFVAMSREVINTFTIGKIKIELTETTGTNYALVPGMAVQKDPKVTLKSGSEACWLFVELRKENAFDSYVGYQIADGWSALTGEDGVYYRAVQKTGADTSYEVLKDNQMTVWDTLTEEQASLITQAPKLTVYAYAIQSDSVATATEAWAILQAELEA